MSELIQKGGPTLLLIFVLVLPGLAISVIHAIKPRPWSMWVGWGLVALVLAIGAAGTMMGRGRVDSVQRAGESPADIEMMKSDGYAEAWVPLKGAGIVGGMFAVALAIGQLRRRR